MGTVQDEGKKDGRKEKKGGRSEERKKDVVVEIALTIGASEQ